MSDSQEGCFQGSDQMNKQQKELKLCREQADRADKHCDAGSDFFHEGARESAQLLFSLNNQTPCFQF